MTGAQRVVCIALAILGVGGLAGCSEKADESKPLSEIKAEAQELDTGELREMAMKYKDAIVAKQKEVAGLKDKLKEIPVTEIAGEEAKKLNESAAELAKSVKALTERFDVYCKSLKDKEGDLSGLDLK